MGEPRLHGKGFHAPPFLHPKSGQVMNLRGLGEWRTRKYSLLSVIGELHHLLINYSRQPQAFDISYQVTQDAKPPARPAHAIVGHTQQALPRSSHIKGGFLDERPPAPEEEKRPPGAEVQDLDSDSLRKPDVDEIMQTVKTFA